MLVIKEKTAKSLLVEIANRLDQLEVKGNSVDHLFRIKMAYKIIVESIDEIPDEHSEKPQDESIDSRKE